MARTVSKKKCERMKQKILMAVGYFLTGVLFLTGFLVFICPLLAGRMTDQSAAEEMERFYDSREETSVQDAEEESGPAEEPDEKSRLYEEMQKYNQGIARNGQSGLVDAWAYEQSSIDLSEYGLYDAPVGVIRIPGMEVELPIYLGASKNNMSKGAAQLGQTSMPIGGTDTNCVLAAHRGYYGSPFFREIERLEIGDEVYIDNLWETLVYRVTGTAVILPDEIDKVLIQKGKDMVTLVTCHPYTKNYQRYVVYCERILENEENQVEIENTSAPPEVSGVVQSGSSEFLIGLDRSAYIIIPVLLAALELCLLWKERKARKKQAGASRKSGGRE